MEPITVENSIIRIKKMRVNADYIIKTFDTLSPSAEVVLAKRAMQMSKSFLGKMLSEYGTENPYPNSSNPTNEIIEPQADISNENIVFDTELSQIEKVKLVRLNIEKFEELFMDNFANTDGNGGNDKIFELYLTTAFTEQSKAKMWLGWELDRIRSNDELSANKEAIAEDASKIFHNNQS